MRFNPSFIPLCLVIALMAGGLGTQTMASNHDEASPNDAQGNAQQASQALDDDALHEKYGITPGALKRDEPASAGGKGDDGQAQNDAGQAQRDDGQASERGGMEEQEGDAGDAITDDTEAEEVDEGIDETEMEQRED